MSKKVTPAIGIEARCPSCGKLITVTVDKKLAKQLYKSFKGSYQ